MRPLAVAEVALVKRFASTMSVGDGRVTFGELLLSPEEEETAISLVHKGLLLERAAPDPGFRRTLVPTARLLAALNQFSVACGQLGVN